MSNPSYVWWLYGPLGRMKPSCWLCMRPFISTGTSSQFSHRYSTQYFIRTLISHNLVFFIGIIVHLRVSMHRGAGHRNVRWWCHSCIWFVNYRAIQTLTWPQHLWLLFQLHPRHHWAPRRHLWTVSFAIFSHHAL